MFRTPPRQGTENPVPAAKLGAVTRKSNEINELLHDLKNNLPLIKTLFTEYLTRVDALIQSCSEEHEEWLSKNMDIIGAFRSKIENLIYPKPPKSTTSRISSKISSRASSSASKVLTQLAQQKAKIRASQATSAASKQLELEELKVRQESEMKMLEIKQRKEKCDEEKALKEVTFLEEELINLDEAASIDRDSQLSVPQENLASTSNVAVPCEDTVTGIQAALSSMNLITSTTEKARCQTLTPGNPPIVDQFGTYARASTSRNAVVGNTGNVPFIDTHVRVGRHNTPLNSAGPETVEDRNPRTDPIIDLDDDSRRFSTPLNPVIIDDRRNERPMISAIQEASASTNEPNLEHRSRNDHTSANDNLNSRMIDILERQNEITNTIAMCQQRSMLPERQIIKFDGSDVTKFKLFRNNFNRAILRECQSDSDRYIYLQQCTSDKAHRLVNSCSHYDATTAFNTAMNLLETEYGNEFKVSNEYLRRLNNWPIIKNDDVRALEELSVFLLECHHYCESMTSRNQLQSPKEIMNVVLKLPFKLRDSWRRHCHRIQSAYREVNFKHLVDFVAEEVSVLKQPLFGDIGGQPERTTKSTFSGSRKNLATNTTNTDTNSQYCFYCKMSNHLIRKCKFFEKLSFKDKSDFVRKTKLCYSCLKRGHFSNKCEKKLKCDKCEQEHPTIMHVSERSSTTSGSTTSQRPFAESSNLTSRQTTESSASTSASTSCASMENRDERPTKIIYPYLPVRVRVGQGEEVLVNCVLDSCSSNNWASEKLLSKLKLKTQSKDLALTTMDDCDVQRSVKIINNLHLTDFDRNNSIVIPVVYAKTTKAWPFSREDLTTKADLEELPHLKDIPFNFVDVEIDLLVGLSVPRLMKPMQTSEGFDDLPYASKHIFGWTLNGPVSRESTRIVCNRISTKEELSLDSYVEQVFAEDFIDNSPTQKGLSIDDKKFFERVQSSIKKLPDDHFEIALPLKDGSHFPQNRTQALQLFHGTKKRLDKDEKLYLDYNEFMENMFNSGFAEMIPSDQINVTDHPVWYITHHAVYHKQKKKIRVVFNGSLKCGGISLNDNLIPGPDLTNSLFGVLLRFRSDVVAVTADIRKMFYQVRVPPHHSDLLRFFWTDGASGKVIECRLLVHLFGAVSSPAIAQYALKESVKHLEKENSLRKTIENHFYVDDLLKAYKDVKTAKSEVPQVVKLLAKSGFTLTSFNSSSSEVLQSVTEELTSSVVQLPSPDPGRALGVTWNIERDTLSYNISINENPDLTKRILLKTLASIYDPQGYASPALIDGKRLFQEACKLHIPWDEEIPRSLKESWNKWVKNINVLPQYEIERCWKKKPTEKIEIHTFADGSEKAYGCVTYAKCFHSDDTVSTSIIASKSRLTPLNNTTLKTIPRIELCAAKLSVELAIKVKSELNEDATCVFWSDSTTVLSYIKSESMRFHRFVSNKVSFIRSVTDPNDWHYVNTKENPADLISRGCSVKTLIKSSLWNNGPTFLRNTHNDMENNLEVQVDSNDLEVKSTMNLTCKTEASPVDQLLHSCSSWYKLRMRVASLRLLQHCIRQKVSLKNREISVNDLNEAELQIIKYLQNKYYAHEITMCSKNQSINKNSALRKLAPFLDSDNILRVGGRLSRSNLTNNQKHPIILPPSFVAELILQETHAAAGHLGRENVVSLIRQKYHIIRLNFLVRKLLKNCVTCRRVNGKPAYQIMSDLPVKRVASDVAPFTNTGTDLFGPFVVHRGRKTEKRYGIVFTCMSSRAIHLEVAENLSTDAYINALRRFVCRRGNVECIVSDNGTNLVGTNKELRESIQHWNKEHIKDRLRQRKIQWDFNPATGSHHGGVFEREIRTIRKTLNSILNCQNIKLSDDSLNTLLCEIEAIMNNRPLTEVTSDDDNAEALTPNHILLFNAGVTYPPGLFSQDDLYVRQRWRQVQYLADLFWHRWRKEYLTGLQERQKWQKVQENIQVNDMVLVIENSSPRNYWPLGRIMSVNSDKNGVVRSASVRISRCRDTKGNSLSSTEVVRPIVKMIKLFSP